MNPYADRIVRSVDFRFGRSRWVYPQRAPDHKLHLTEQALARWCEADLPVSLDQFVSDGIVRGKRNAPPWLSWGRSQRFIMNRDFPAIALPCWCDHDNGKELTAITTATYRRALGMMPPRYRDAQLAVNERGWGDYRAINADLGYHQARRRAA